MIIVERPVASANFRQGRALSGGLRVDMITVHVTEGSAASVRHWFNNPTAEVSAHYMVTKRGEVDQFVDEDDTAFHNGRVWAPTAPLVLERPGINPNVYSIGIEHEGDGRSDLTAAQRIASAELMADIAKRRRIPLTRRHVVRHSEVYAKKTCPGRIDIDQLVVLAAASSVSPTPLRPPAPRVVWSPYRGEWLVVAKIDSDREWYYVPASRLIQSFDLQRATVSLSEMERAG